MLSARLVPPARRVPVTDTPPSTAGRPSVLGLHPSPAPAPPSPPAALRDRPSPDPAAGPPRTSRWAGRAPAPLAAAGSQSRPRSSRAGSYSGDSDQSGLHAPGGGGAGARVPAVLAPSRAPGTQGRGRGGVTGRAPAAAPARPGLGARARNLAARARGTRWPRPAGGCARSCQINGGVGTYQSAEVGGHHVQYRLQSPSCLSTRMPPQKIRVKSLLWFRVDEEELPQHSQRLPQGPHSLSPPLNFQERRHS